LILMVEEDHANRAFLVDQLTADGYEIVVADSRRYALALVVARRPALVLADLNGRQTLGLLDAVRAGEGLAGEIDRRTPMIVLTARTDELARVRVFDRGGDDVVVSKPFSYPELHGRIRALLRRAHQPRPAAVSRVGALTVDHNMRWVRVGDRGIELAAKEYELLRALIADPTRVHSKAELLRDVWGLPACARTRTLESHAARLRAKLAAAGPGRRLVIAVRGVGYRLCDGEVLRRAPSGSPTCTASSPCTASRRRSTASPSRRSTGSSRRPPRRSKRPPARSRA
jgi:DNA-binding response OmpR family regulator